MTTREASDDRGDDRRQEVKADALAQLRDDFVALETDWKYVFRDTGEGGNRR